MENKKSLLSNNLNINVSESTKSVINEAFEKRIKEVVKAKEKEIYETLAKNNAMDQKKIVEAMNKVLNETVAKQTAKLEIHNKKLIAEQQALRKEKDNIKKSLADKEALLVESYNKKIKLIAEKLQERYNAKNQSISESMNKIVDKHARLINEASVIDRKKLAESLQTLVNLIGAKSKELVKKQLSEQKSLDALKVELIKENELKLKSLKKEFYESTALKVGQFIDKVVKNEVLKHRSEILEARKNSIGQAMFEQVALLVKKDYFNKDKAIKSVIESVKKKSHDISGKLSLKESEIEKLKKENKILSEQQAIFTRDRMITEAVKNLPTEQQKIVRTMVKTVKTENLSEALSRSINTITSMSNNSSSSKKDVMLHETKKPVKIMTGNRQIKSVINEAEENNEITALIASCNR